MKTGIAHSPLRLSYLSASLMMLALPLAGCLGGGGGGSDDGRRTGTFVDSPVAGLDFSAGSQTGTTSDTGTFSYRAGETVTFSIGDLVLGSAGGAEVMTPLSIIQGATDASDRRVNNLLILLQSLDADGNLNNGIQITEQIRTEVSLAAAGINFDQPVADFRTAIGGLIGDLESAGAFSDTDPRERKVVAADDAREHFSRSTGERMVVTTTGGELRGFEANDTTWQFLGVPYAKPPLGELRWRAPQPAEPWEGVRDAVAWSDQAAQNAALERFGEGGMSEDSLYLNITMPKDADNLPVMVWFHGGGFTALTSNTIPFNNPEAVASKGVVQVSVNHRLGAFGYLAHPALTAESSYGGSGNYGQMDLIMALQWVQDNIEAFGGNPDNVTIFGESGGGRKVLSLMASPQAAGLFHRAISQSGTLRPDTRSLADGEALGLTVQERMGASSLAEMREATWQEVTAAATGAEYTNIDNYYLPVSERALFETDQDNDVPFMFSVNTNDTEEPTYTAINVFPWMAPLKAQPMYATLFAHQPAGWRARGMQAYHAAELAYLFNMPSSVVTHYQLGLVLDPATGSPLVIGDLNENGVSGSRGDPADIMTSAGFDATDEQVIDRMMTIWTNFARTGNPSIDGDISYPTYDATSEAYVELTGIAEAKLYLGDALSDD
ncbi:carboxylesterase family protein [Halopseudomonas sp.]|uniref:carboxylesterase/lipase family protein n=1 Tax=Halopseudomonas sp. TaxID=2901191 RepID=UPI00311F3ABA